MIETVFRCDELPRADRFDYWREQMTNLIAPMEMSSEHTRDFEGEARVIELGAAHVWPTKFRPMRFRRTPKLIRQSDPELFHFSFLQQGTLQVSQGRRETAYGHDGLYVVDTSRPYDCVAYGDSADRRGPGDPEGADPPSPTTGSNRCSPGRIPGREGIGALLAGFLTRLASDNGHLPPLRRPAPGDRADRPRGLPARPRPSRPRTPCRPRRTSTPLILRVQNFIRRNLHDPQLTPAAVAAAHHISVSYLHRLFRAQDTTVSGWIRQQRLDRVRRDLADPGPVRAPAAPARRAPGLHPARGLRRVPCRVRHPPSELPARWS